VARALSIALGSSSSGPVAVGGTTNPQAQDLLLQATALEGDDSSRGMLRRIELLDQATRLDPNYAEAHARKALYQCIWGSTWAANNDEKNKAMSQALLSARRAVAIEPELPAGYASLGLIYSNQLEMKSALEALRRSVNLAGADVSAFTNYGIVLSRALRQAEGEAMLARATNLDPLNAQAWAVQSWALFNGRRYSESADAARHALSIAPRHLRARTLLAWNLLLLGRVDDAQRELKQVPADDYRKLVAEASIAARAKRPDDALLALETLRKGYADTAKYQEAEIYAQLGDKDQAIKALEAAWSLRDSGLAAIQVDPFLDPIRKDPRIRPIVQRIFG
jgi:tetratricopeptide (TPR) repeat protein